MNYGNKIACLRKSKNMTQAELGEKLNVSYQAVSKWERGTSQPDFETMIKISKLFNINLEEFKNCENENNEIENNEKVIKKIQLPPRPNLNNQEIGEQDSDEQVSNEQPVNVIKPILCNCDDCYQPIYDNVYKQDRNAGGDMQKIALICETCYNKHLQLNNERKDLENEIKELNLKKEKKLHTLRKFAWATFGGILTLILAINSLSALNTGDIISSIILSYAVFAVIFCLIADTYIKEVFMDVAEFGFVKFPGIIFEFSIEGFGFLIAMKILFWILGIVFAVLGLLLALGISMFLAMFSFPFCIKK